MPFLGPRLKGPLGLPHSREPIGTPAESISVGGGYRVRLDSVLPPSRLMTLDKSHNLFGPLLSCLQNGARDADLLGKLYRWRIK